MRRDDRDIASAEEAAGLLHPLHVSMLGVTQTDHNDNGSSATKRSSERLSEWHHNEGQ